MGNLDFFLIVKGGIKHHVPFAQKLAQIFIKEALQTGWSVSRTRFYG